MHLPYFGSDFVPSSKCALTLTHHLSLILVVSSMRLFLFTSPSLFGALLFHAASPISTAPLNHHPYPLLPQGFWGEGKEKLKAPLPSQSPVSQKPQLASLPQTSSRSHLSAPSDILQEQSRLHDDKHEAFINQ